MKASARKREFQQLKEEIEHHTKEEIVVAQLVHKSANC